MTDRISPRRCWVLLAICLAVPIAVSWYQSTHPPAPEKPATPEKLAPEKLAAILAQRAAAAKMIRSWGYDCQTVDEMVPYALSEGWTVACNKYRYLFHLENHGGKWSVKAD